MKIFCVVTEFYDAMQGRPMILHNFVKCQLHELMLFMEVLQQSPDVRKMVLFQTDKMDYLDLKNRLTRADIGLDIEDYLPKFMDK